MRSLIIVLSTIGFIFVFESTQAQNDTIVTKDNNQIVGEVKDMSKGVLTVKTQYSDSDFKIKWKKIKEINTESEYLISVVPEGRYNGRIAATAIDSVAIIQKEDTLIKIPIKNIFYLREVKSGFLNNFSGSLSVGLNIAKAEELQELSVRSRFGYRADRWSLDAHYNDIRSSRKEVETIRRLEGALSFTYFLKHNWFTVSEVSFYSNSELNIKLRTLAKLGIGKLLIQTNKMYWGVQTGITFNNENYDVLDEKDFQNSGEAFFGTELNLYDVEDFSLLTRAVYYPSVTESHRWRFDYNIDLKYDLPLDFFIKVGFTFNYDKKPVGGAPQSDYIFQTTLGWEFN